MKTQCNWQLKQAMKSLLMFGSIPFCYFTLIWAFPPLITLSPFELHQATLARLASVTHHQKCAGGIFWHTSSVCACAVLPYPVSALVPATQNLLLWQHNYIFSRAVAAVSFKRGRDCVVCACVRACMLVCRCLAALHSTPLSPAADACESPCPLTPDEP